MDDFADLNRRLESLLREGTVIDVDHDARRVRVESGGLQTDWIRWLAQRTGNSITWDPPSIGEPGLLLCPSGEPTTGLFLPGVYCDGHDAPSSYPNEHLRVYPDGARVAYDAATGHLAVTGIKTATVQGSGTLTIDMPKVIFTGDVTIKGAATVMKLLSYMAGLAGEGGDVGTIMRGNITHEGGTLRSNGVSVDGHTHIDSMGGTTSKGRG
ncbi:baseplate assembly protein [Burkholderia ubonensis]|uniref:phage baseplate assembly protein V n=1 Tax=Burkholderia ubonensis TaxID=101571 RepID=UPI000755002B|nr:phage baseplate assembly protein V [Burkholderia ubonensis]KVO85395.1 baseplate assembly protein [Burkholderia ubonensis]KVZ38623.1 baseplate assembly protein [Burkholderia ubonensis]KVZ67161.1 baseplate assembly protein [Burkholderia ubonensis]KVZ72821.1 baseplate assembly protein [Burkholderia ubonensis]